MGSQQCWSKKLRRIKVGKKSKVIAEHKRTSVRTGQTLLNPPNSSIHALQEGHDININCFKIIHKPELNSINISDSIFIKKFSSDLNNQDASTILNI